jgi:hypothetical protein
MEIKEKKVLCFGEEIIGVEFAEVKDTEVYKVKVKFAELVNELKQNYLDNPKDSVKSLLFDHALGELINAQMMVVKVITYN